MKKPKESKCTICNDNFWKIMVNVYTGKEFAARCTCMETIDKKRKPYTAFINYNPNKFMTLEDYTKMNVPF
jgi:hypothetical protein